MTSENTYGERFTQACLLRDEGRLEEAISLLEGIVPAATAANDQKLLAHSHVQLGHVYDMRRDLLKSERHYREATRVAPRLEIASLGLFHALWELQRWEDALHEMLRFLGLRYSEGYRELLADLKHLSAAEVALADKARSLLGRFQ